MIKYITDFVGAAGGAESTDAAIIERLESKLGYKIPIEQSKFVRDISSEDTYIISNRIFLSEENRRRLVLKGTYILIEHDYQFVPNRNPWFYEDGIVPEHERIWIDFYAGAKATFFQTDFHLNMYKKNNVPTANPISMGLTIFSDKDLDFLLKLHQEYSPTIKEIAIYGTPSYGKNTEGTIKYCREGLIPYRVIQHTHKDLFLKELSKHETFIFLPITPETCCKIVMEARIIGLNVITTNNYGYTLSPWYGPEWTGKKLIDQIKLLNVEAIDKIYGQL